LSLNIDQNKFMNLLVEKTNQKLSQLQNQVILLETQLQLALEQYQTLQAEHEKIKKKKDKNTEDSTPS
jgi:hypothetical protein